MESTKMNNIVCSVIVLACFNMQPIQEHYLSDEQVTDKLELLLNGKKVLIKYYHVRNEDNFVQLLVQSSSIQTSMSRPDARIVSIDELEDATRSASELRADSFSEQAVRDAVPLGQEILDYSTTSHTTDS
jgi:hypothetical protein